MRQRLEIRIEGLLDLKWAEWFPDFELTHTEVGTTTLSGWVSDQAALYGLITNLRDLGAKLVSLTLEAPCSDCKPLP